MLKVDVLGEYLKYRECFACFRLFDVFIFRVRQDSFFIQITEHFTSQKVRRDLDQLAGYLASLQAKCHCVIGSGASLNILGQVVKDVVDCV